MEEKQIVRKISLIGIFGNLLLSCFKLIAGFAGGSSAMVSDAVHSFSDVFATLIAFAGVRISEKHADREHPYGHERFECLASLALGLILVTVGLGIGAQGVLSIVSGEYRNAEPPTLLPLIAAIVSIVSKEAMYRYTMHYAKKLNSAAFRADAWHHRSDALSSIGSLIGIAGARLGFPILEPLASVLICLFILKVAYDILKDSVSRMMDTSCGSETEKKMAEYIASLPGVERLDLLQTRTFGSRVFADVEITVHRTLSLLEAHDIAESVHDGIEKTFPEVKHVMVHVNPCDGEDEPENE